MELGERLLRFRARNNLSQRQLAKLLDENLGSIFRIEKGIVKPHKAHEISIIMKLDELEEKEGRTE